MEIKNESTWLVRGSNHVRGQDNIVFKVVGLDKLVTATSKLRMIGYKSVTNLKLKETTSGSKEKD